MDVGEGLVESTGVVVVEPDAVRRRFDAVMTWA